MGERVILIEGIDPLALFGVNNAKYDLIAKHFPKLKIVARGHELKAIGDKEQIDILEDKINKMIEFFGKYKYLTDANIEDFLDEFLFLLVEDHQHGHRLRDDGEQGQRGDRGRDAQAHAGRSGGLLRN